MSEAAGAAITDPFIEPLDLRRTSGTFGTGVTVITTRLEGEDHGMTANAFMSVSLDPPLVLVSVDRRARMLAKIETTRRYAISILSEEMADIAMHFAGKPPEWLHTPFVDFGGMPVIRGALAHFVARLEQAIPAGDHVLFLGRVEHLNRDQGRPLIFHDGQFCAMRDAKHQAAPLSRTEGAPRIASRYVEDAPEFW